MKLIILKSLSVVKEILREKLGTTNAHELYELCNGGWKRFWCLCETRVVYLRIIDIKTKIDGVWAVNGEFDLGDVG